MMNHRLIAACLLSVAIACGTTAELGAPSWQPLFNGRDFAGWDKHLSTEGGRPIAPNQDPHRVFTVVELEGERAIRVSGEKYGAITTQEEFDNFHFKLDFRWGEKRWAPRATVGRDSGILYAGVGAPNPGTGWMTSVENNIMEKGVGQWWSVNGAIIDVEGEWVTAENELYVPYKKEGSGERNIVWRRGAPIMTAEPANGITPPFDVEAVFGNWNTVEVIFWGGLCLHLLDGKVNLVAFNPRYQKEGVWQPLARGKIQLQSEAAELFYKNIQIRPLVEIPPQFLADVPSPVGGEEGFVPLFADTALPAWKQSGPGRFVVQEGVATGQGGMGLWWYSGRAFTNFVLRGEFLQEQGDADSGVFVRFPAPGDDPWVAVRQGHEMEIGDAGAENPTWRTGSIYPFKAPVANASAPPGEWTTYEMVCRGHDYSVRLNGRLVTTWTDPERRSTHGFIGLQNYNDDKTVRHRRMRVKELP